MEGSDQENSRARTAPETIRSPTAAQPATPSLRATNTAALRKRAESEAMAIRKISSRPPAARIAARSPGGAPPGGRGSTGRGSEARGSAELADGGGAGRHISSGEIGGTTR